MPLHIVLTTDPLSSLYGAGKGPVHEVEIRKDGSDRFDGRFVPDSRLVDLAHPEGFLEQLPVKRRFGSEGGTGSHVTAKVAASVA